MGAVSTSNLETIARCLTQQGEALIHPVMRAGGRVQAQDPLKVMRERTLAEYTRLPETLRGLDTGPAYCVEVSSALQELAGKVDRGEL